jgi:chromosome partitioning protein
MFNMTRSGPKIVVLGNHKGGSGKSTLAMHLVIAGLQAGIRIASIDLDHEQGSLTRYIDNRRAWAKKARIELAFPSHHCIGDCSHLGEAGNAAALTRLLSSLEHNHDLIVIDTPSGSGQLNLLAHGLADSLISPINDSFLDLDVIYKLGYMEDRSQNHSPYTRSVAAALAARRTVTEQPTDWVVVRNRLSPLGSRNERNVLTALERIAVSVGFRLVPGLIERVIYREFFPVGLTAFDPLEVSVLGVKPTLSHLLARHEVRDLLASCNLVPRTGRAGTPTRNTVAEWQSCLSEQTMRVR